jgi:N-acetylglucosaminyl-diphospho-decaprenol L-rhamnosyltransferase
VAHVAVVVVTYNSADVIAPCLASVAGYEVIVADNASVDQTVAVARTNGARVLANDENRGFAAAVNQGFRATSAELVLVLNPDVEVQSTLDPLCAAALRHGVAGGRLVDEQGVAQQGFTIRRFPSAGLLGLELLGINRLWPKNPWNRDYRYLDRDLTQSGPAEQPAGAFLMVRRDVWAQLGGFDEAFHPIWFEDVDFCLRAAQAGFPAYYEAATVGLHQGGHSIRKLQSAERQCIWYDSLLRFAGKHFRPSLVWMIGLAGALGVWPRAVVRAVAERSLRPVWDVGRIYEAIRNRLVSRPQTGLRPGSENKQ